MDGLVQRLQGGAIFVFNNLTFQEVVVETGGMSAERSTGGVQMNIVPRDGGNTFSGSFSTSHSTPAWQADNLTDELRARGLGFSPSLKKHYDTGGAIGGPIVRDRLWFFNAYRFGGEPAVSAGQLLQQASEPARRHRSGLARHVLRAGPRPAGVTPTITTGTTACG